VLSPVGGNTVTVIEHNSDVIKKADHIIPRQFAANGPLGRHGYLVFQPYISDVPFFKKLRTMYRFALLFNLNLRK
jgi:hypothetical protein